MNLQIERLIVWPKADGFKRNEIKFKLDCVNVLSGESRTGKSAVSSIIDYCLGSSDCNIPIGRVRENVSWFGIVVVMDSGRWLLARRNPMDEVCTSESLIKEIAVESDIPDSITAGTDDASEVTTRLGQEGGVPDISRGDYGFTSKRLGFRDTTHLLFQVQDIVANRYILFYKMQKAEIMEHFSAWFNFIIGAETLADVMNRQELEEINRQLRLIDAEKEKLRRKVITWNNKLRARLVEAKSLNFCYADAEVPTDDKKLLHEAKRLVKNRDSLMAQVRQDDSVKKEIAKLREESRSLSESVDALSAEVDDLQDLKESIVNQGSATQKLKDRLSIARWLKANAQASQSVCPVCGGTTHDEAAHELDKIVKVVEDCERALQNSAKFPAATLTEIQEKENRLAGLKKSQRDVDEQLRELIDIDDKSARDYLERTNRASALFEALAFIVELNEQVQTGVDDSTEKMLRARAKEIREVFDEQSIKDKETERLSKIGELALARLQTLDSEEQYRQFPPIFKKRDMNIVIKDAKGKEHTLGEVGSASNWVALHIAVTCAFQEFFAAMKNPSSCVPNFMVYDQPSQVYFPCGKKDQKDPHAQGAPEVDEEPSETDKLAVKKIFATIAKSISDTKERFGKTWQAIVLEHAGSDIYGDIEGINELPAWRNKTALIPHEWYADEEGDKAST